MNSKTKQTNTRLSTSDKQNSKTVRPKVPPRCGSLKASYEQVTADLSAQLPTDGTGFFTSDQTF